MNNRNDYSRSQQRRLRLESLETRQLLAVDVASFNYDVSGDGHVGPLDVLQVINALQVTRDGMPVDLRMDVNQDGLVSPLDALVIINQLNSNRQDQSLDSLGTRAVRDSVENHQGPFSVVRDALREAKADGEVSVEERQAIRELRQGIEVGEQDLEEKLPKLRERLEERREESGDSERAERLRKRLNERSVDSVFSEQGERPTDRLGKLREFRRAQGNA